MSVDCHLHLLIKPMKTFEKVLMTPTTIVLDHPGVIIVPASEFPLNISRISNKTILQINSSEVDDNNSTNDSEASFTIEKLNLSHFSLQLMSPALYEILEYQNVKELALKIKILNSPFAIYRYRYGSKRSILGPEEV